VAFVKQVVMRCVGNQQNSDIIETNILTGLITLQGGHHVAVKYKTFFIERKI
jgi:hypothetical protein